MYAPVNPHTKYMRIYRAAREREAGKNKMTKIIRCNGLIDELLVIL